MQATDEHGRRQQRLDHAHELGRLLVRHRRDELLGAVEADGLNGHGHGRLVLRQRAGTGAEGQQHLVQAAEIVAEQLVLALALRRRSRRRAHKLCTCGTHSTHSRHTCTHLHMNGDGLVQPDLERAHASHLGALGGVRVQVRGVKRERITTAATRRAYVDVVVKLVHLDALHVHVAGIVQVVAGANARRDNWQHGYEGGPEVRPKPATQYRAL